MQRLRPPLVLAPLSAAAGGDNDEVCVKAGGAAVSDKLDF